MDLYCSHDQYRIDLKLDGIDAQINKIDNAPMADLRLPAARIVRARGIDYLVIGEAFSAARDMAADPAGWGLVQIAEEGGAKVYRIE